MINLLSVKNKGGQNDLEAIRMNCLALAIQSIGKVHGSPVELAKLFESYVVKGV